MRLNPGFNRIQFTPDLMPSDITGTEIIEENKTTGGREFKFVKGPIFTNILLADEINRTPPKTQAALLQAMEESQVTVGGQTYELPQPFFVLATQNPIEQEGTYPLPEAQLDRFMFDIRIGPSDHFRNLGIRCRDACRTHIAVLRQRPDRTNRSVKRVGLQLWRSALSGQVQSPQRKARFKSDTRRQSQELRLGSTDLGALRSEFQSA